MQRRQIWLRFQKWGGLPHYHHLIEPLGHDDHGWWLAGTKILAPGRDWEPPAEWNRPRVMLIPAEGLWIATFHPAGELEIYVDVTSRPEIGPEGVTAVDLDLDVIRLRDGRALIDDEDEFAEHQRSLGYPPEVVRTARATADWLLAAVSGRREPFGTASARWLDRLG